MSVAPRIGPMSSPVLVPPASGPIAVLQGAYGDRGNFELLFPDPDDGLWVCWRNNDRDAVADVPPGGWSAGLRFATGARYDDVAFLQARRGPDFLEVLASTGNRLHRWTWSPGPGFERTDVLEVPGVGRLVDLQLVETHRGFVALARAGDDCLVWRVDGTTYPRLAWTAPEHLALPEGIDRLAVRLGPDDVLRGLVLRSGRLWSCDDVAAGEWAVLDLAGVDAICAIVASPNSQSTCADLLVATEQRLVGIGGPKSLSLELSGVEALAAGVSYVEQATVEVVVRTGHELRHATVPC